MKTIVRLATIFFLSFSLAAQQGWEWQNPYLQGNTLRAVNGIPLWAVGDGGTAIRSLGPNFIWEEMNVPTEEILFDLSAHRPFAMGDVEYEGWIVGDNGVIFHTNNSGDTWEKQNSGTTERLYAVSGSIDACVWAVGRNGTILKSIDQGETWEKINTHFTMNFYGVDHFHCNEAWIVGEDGIMISTTDGGETWQSHANRTSYDLFSIDLGPQGAYQACGHAGVVIVSDDAGETWEKGNESLSQKMNSVDVINMFGKSSVVGDDGLILETSDGGESFVQNNAGVFWDLHDVVTGYSASGSETDKPTYIVGQYGVILKNDGYGMPYEIINERYLHWLSAIEFVDENKGWAAGGEPGWVDVNVGKILGTTDGGETWEELYTQDVHISDMDFVNEDKGWIVGKKGLIKKSSNGGKNWTTQSSGVSSDLTGVSFVDEEFGWAVSRYGDVLHTSDGGSNWVRQINPFASGAVYNNPLHDVYFISRDVGCAVGLSATILHTIDGGTTWSLANVNASRSYRFASVFFYDESLAWATGIYGSIFLSTDGGANWQEIESGTSLLLEHVYFIDPDHGWIVGDQGAVFESRDGGYTWMEQKTPVAFNYLSSVWFTDENNGWACGEGGTILRTKSGGFSYEHGTVMHHDLELPIQDNLETNDVIMLPLPRSSQAYRLTDMKVLLDTVLHPKVEELIVTISHHGITDTLVKRDSGAGANFVHTTLWDQATLKIENGKAPYYGTYMSAGNLSKFMGMDPSGEWRLGIHDVVSGNEGILQSWGIVPSYEKVTSVKNIFGGNLIEAFECYPNPARDFVRISWTTMQREPSNIIIFDVNGKLLKTVDGKTGAPGDYYINLDISSWKSGVYFYQLRCGEQVHTKKMLVL